MVLPTTTWLQVRWWILAVLAVAATGGVFIGPWAGSPVPAPAPESSNNPEATFALEGADVTIHEGEWLRLRARARQVMLVPRSFGPLEVGPLKELVVTGARFEVREEPGCGGRSPCAERVLADPTLGLVSLTAGLISLRLVSGMLFDPSWVVVRDGVVVARFSAREGRVGIGGRSLVLLDFELEQVPTARHVRAGRAVWSPEDRAFRIDGDYALMDGSRAYTGRGLLIGITTPAEG
jgi:hypothetical protein